MNSCACAEFLDNHHENFSTCHTPRGIRIHPAIPGGLDQVGGIQEKEKRPGLITERVNCFVYKFVRFPIWSLKNFLFGDAPSHVVAKTLKPAASRHRMHPHASGCGTGNCAYGNFRSERMPRTMNTSICGWLTGVQVHHSNRIAHTPKFEVDC